MLILASTKNALKKRMPPLIIKDKSGALLVTLLIPINFVCFCFAGGGLILPRH